MRIFPLLLIASLAPAAVVVDRIAVVTGNRIIKASDIERNLRLISFLNSQSLDLSVSARRAAADRLIDQQFIRQELSAHGYQRATDEDATALSAQILKDRFGGVAAQLQAALQRYGLTEAELHEQLLWQLTVLRFIDERFRPGVLVSDDDVEAYYNGHLAEIRKESPKDSTLGTVSGKIRTTLEGQRIDLEFNTWMEESRRQTRVEYKEAAFQ